MTQVQTTLGDLRTQLAPRETTMPAVTAGYFDLQSFELLQRISKAFAASELVPQQYRGNVANCMIALSLAQRVGADPLMCMQNLVIVHGRPTWSAQFLIATANMCGRFTALRFEFFGDRNADSWGCRAWAIEKSTNERLVGSDVTIAIAKKEGWFSKNGSKWQSIPQQMLMYRAGSWWVRAYAPELSMGLMTADELHDVYDASRGSDGTFEVELGDIKTDAAAEEPVDISAAVPEEPQPEKQPASHRGKPKPAPQAPAEPAGDAQGKGPAMTFAEVAGRLQRAKTQDARDEAASLISLVADEGQRDELSRMYDEVSGQA